MVILCVGCAFFAVKGIYLNGRSGEIGDLDRAVPVELGKVYRSPEGLWRWLLAKNDVLRDDGLGITDSDRIKAIRTSNILETYQFKMKL